MIAVALAVALRRRGMLDDVEIVASDISPERPRWPGRTPSPTPWLIGSASSPPISCRPPERLPTPFRVPAEFDVVAANGLRPQRRPRRPAAGSLVASLRRRSTAGRMASSRSAAARPARAARLTGIAFLEIGADQGEAIVTAAVERLPGWSCSVSRDLGGRPRVARLERAAVG